MAVDEDRIVFYGRDFGVIAEWCVCATFRDPSRYTYGSLLGR